MVAMVDAVDRKRHAADPRPPRPRGLDVAMVDAVDAVDRRRHDRDQALGAFGRCQVAMVDAVDRRRHTGIRVNADCVITTASSPWSMWSIGDATDRTPMGGVSAPGVAMVDAVDAVDRRRHSYVPGDALALRTRRHGRCGRSETPRHQRLGALRPGHRSPWSMRSIGDATEEVGGDARVVVTGRHGRCGRSETPVDTSIGQGNGRQSRKVVLPPPRWKAFCRSPRIRHRTGRLPAAPAPER